MLLQHQIDVSQILKNRDRGRGMGPRFLIPEKAAPIFMQIHDVENPDNGYQEIEKQLLINDELENQMMLRSGLRDPNRKKVHMNVSDMAYTHDEIEKMRTQSKVSHWSMKDARNDQLKPAYIDEEETQESNSSREDFDPTATKKKQPTAKRSQRFNQPHRSTKKLSNQTHLSN